MREPVLIRELVAGLPIPVDPGTLVPALGEFVVALPSGLAGARLGFERRELDGSRTPLGDVALDAVPERAPSPFVGTEVARIRGTAAPADALDIAILGDGYRKDDLPLFDAQAERVADELLRQPPYADYARRIVVHRVDLVSRERGASYDCARDEVIEGCADRARDTALGSTFPLRVATMLGLPVSDRAVMQRSPWSVAEAAALVPYDAIIVLVATAKSGGFGLYQASVPAFQDGMERTAVHELGHAFAKLGDEYAAPGDPCQDVLLTPDFPNVTARVTDPARVPWRAWLTPGVPLPTPRRGAWSAAIGLFAGAGGGCVDHFRPAAECLMHDSDAPLCAVCQEQTVKRLYETVDVLRGVRLERGVLRADLVRQAEAIEPAEPIEGDWLVDGRRVASAATATGAPVPLFVAQVAGPGRHVVSLVARPLTARVRSAPEGMDERVDVTVEVGR
ncbi:MAG: M64 family metallopeptidase [Myxococcota bacterium]